MHFRSSPILSINNESRGGTLEESFISHGDRYLLASGLGLSNEVGGLVKQLMGLRQAQIFRPKNDIWPTKEVGVG